MTEYNIHMNTDDLYLPELTRRQEEILTIIVRSYTENPEPISSKFLAETGHLSVSSATIRNEMGFLEELGYIAAPHTSAGRIPTEKGYRYFVKRLLGEGNLSETEQARIVEKFQGAPLVNDQWMRVAVNILARTAQAAALVTPPIANTSRFKHVELISIQGRLVLMVLVLESGSVHQQMLTLTDPVPQTQLSETAARINALCLEANANEVRMKGVQLRLLEREVIDLAADLMERADSNQVRLIYREGLSEIINSFQTSEGAQQAIRVFEEHAFINMILNDILSPMINNVQVVIAGEERWEELNQLSMVLSRYGVPGQMSGAVGLLGPTHLNYGRAISTVRYVSSMMTNMLSNLYEVQNSQPDTPDDEDAPTKAESSQE
ncbi:MAG: heat-inducible transcription repressor HrcA [Anaerolineaceae bacterium]|nr:heat-inducible transcription repressor HrcA [Anaerolineaceae bacterium]